MRDLVNLEYSEEGKTMTHQILAISRSTVLAIILFGNAGIVSAAVIPNGGGHFQILVMAPTLTDARDTCSAWYAEQGSSRTCREMNTCVDWSRWWDGLCYEGETFIYADAGEFQLTVYIDENKEDKDQMCNGNPIAIPNGDKTQTEVDYTGTGVLPLQIRRQYSSNLLFDGRSDGWRFLFGNRHRMDVEAGANRILVRYPSQGYAIFTSLDGIAWTTDPDITIQLERELELGTHIGWRVTSDNDQVEIFDLEGKATSVQYRGRTHTYTYNDSTTTITDDYGKSLQVVKDSDGYVTSVTNPENEVYSYTYNADGSLTTVTFPDDTFRTYHYEDTSIPNELSKYRLTGITDENGARFATWEYDSDYTGKNPRAILSEHAGSVERVDFSYSDGSVTTTNSLGKDTVYHYQKILGVDRITQVEGVVSPNCAAANKDYTYDANGFRSSKTDWNGNVTTYVHNSEGLATSRTEAFGTPEARTVATEWHPTLRLPIKIIEPNLETSYTYNGNGNLLTETLKDLTTNEFRTTTMTYNDTGQVLSIDGPRTDVSDVTTLTYFNCSTGNECGQADTIANALGHIVKFKQYNAHGQPTLLSDPNGSQTVMTYDVRQRLETVTVDGLYTTTIEYDDVGQVTRITAPNGSSLNYKYDDAHRVTKITNNLGESIEYTLDNAGNPTSETVYSAYNEIKRVVSRQYDELSRLREIIGAKGQTTSFEYDVNDNLSQTTNGRSYTTDEVVDALDRIITVTDAKFNPMQYGYDQQDRVTSVTDQRGNTTTYDYNGLGELVTMHSPDTGSSSFIYDDAGNIVQRTDARGVVTQYQYDALNRVIAETYPSNPGLNKTYSYDAASPGNYGVGRLTSIQDASGLMAYSYDFQGRISGNNRIIQNELYATLYAYDKAGNVTGITYPSGRSVSYDRNQTGQVITVRTTDADGETILADNISYLPFGPVEQLTFGNGLGLNRSYDLDYRIAQQDVGNIQSLSYSFDDNNNIDAITDLVDIDASQDFSYDKLDRLIDEIGSYGNKSYLYDAVGNRTERVFNFTDENNVGKTRTQTLVYEEGSNRLILRNDKVVVLDANGNTLSDRGGNKTFDYDEQNRMVASYKKGKLKATYSYNALGQRVIKNRFRTDINGVTEFRRKFVFHYGLNGQLLGETIFNKNNILKIQRHYIWLDNLPLAQITETYKNDGSLKNTVLLYLHVDHLNTPRVATDENQVTVWRWASDAFGMGRAEKDPDGDGIKHNVRLRFPGQYFDSESGLNYNYFRDYDRTTGRYVQSDPIGLLGGINTYAYVGGNPVRWVDPTGEIPLIAVPIVWGFVESVLTGIGIYSASISLELEDHYETINEINRRKDIMTNGLNNLNIAYYERRAQACRLEAVKDNIQLGSNLLNLITGPKSTPRMTPRN